jgi:hypothetical protein
VFITVKTVHLEAITGREKESFEVLNSATFVQPHRNAGTNNSSSNANREPLPRVSVTLECQVQDRT